MKLLMAITLALSVSACSIYAGDDSPSIPDAGAMVDAAPVAPRELSEVCKFTCSKHATDVGACFTDCMDFGAGLGCQ